MSPERRARELAADAAFIEELKRGTPLRLAAAMRGLGPRIVGALLERPEVTAELARVEAELIAKTQTGDKVDRDSAREILEREFAWRKAPPKTIEEVFGDLLHEFAELEPEAYITLRRLISRTRETAAERRVKRRNGGDAGGR